jgi:membrane protein DedA with SNARE-associated domain
MPARKAAENIYHNISGGVNQVHFNVELLNSYGYIVLFVALVLELIAFPLPGDVLLTYSGYLIGQHKLNWLLCILSAATGAITGITISYAIGSKLGAAFFNRYGHFIHLGPERMKKVSGWFNRYGNKLLLVSYFIPGVRHVTGYFTGITKVPYKKFAINSYTGAFIWATALTSLGKVLGNNWDKYHSTISRYAIFAALAVVLILTAVYVYRNYKERIYEKLFETLGTGRKMFKSSGRMKFVIISLSAVFLTLSALVVELVQDFLAKEFDQFNVITSYIIKAVFSDKFQFVMNISNYTASLIAVGILTAGVLILIWVKGIDKYLEAGFILFAFWGGEALQIALRFIFGRLANPGLKISGLIHYSFPSAHAFMAVVLFGFVTYLMIRYTKKAWVGTICTTAAIAICIFAALGPLFFQTENANDVLAGYVFGGLWLSLNIIMLEVYRIMKIVKIKEGKDAF